MRPVVLVASLILAGCVRHLPPAKPMAQAASPARLSSSTVDGNYLGPSRLMQADNRTCPRSRLVETTVFDRGFDIPYREGAGSLQPVHAIIAADHSISGGDGVVSIAGKLDGEVLNLTIASAECQSHAVLRRR